MTHRSRLGGLCIDCQTDNLGPAAGFWGAVLGAEPDPQASGTYAVVGQVRGVSVEVQTVDHPSRVHLDIETDDVAAEVARLTALGAHEVAVVQDWVVMEAPTGHRFCVVPAKGSLDAASVWEAA